MDRPVSLRQRLQVEASKRWEHVSLFASFRGDADLAAPTWKHQYHSPFLASVHEAYLTLYTDHLDMFAGRKIHRWGTGDGINPMDLINPIDTRDPFSSGRADNRVPAELAVAKLSWKNWSLEGVFLPLARVSDLQSRGYPWNAKDYDSIYAAEERGEIRVRNKKPDEWFRQCAWGARLSTFAGGWDLSLLFFSGYISHPVWTPVLVPASGRMTYEARHPHFTAYGINFAKAVGGSSTIRGELAYKPQYRMNFNDEYFPFTGDYVQSVIGIDYDLDSKYYFNIQIFTDFFKGSNERQESKNKIWNGVSYEISGKWLRDDLKAGVRGKIYTSGDGDLTDFFVQYKFNDNVEFNTGVMLWIGSNESAIGRYSENNMLYCNVKFSF